MTTIRRNICHGLTSQGTKCPDITFDEKEYGELLTSIKNDESLRNDIQEALHSALQEMMSELPRPKYPTFKDIQSYFGDAVDHAKLQSAYDAVGSEVNVTNDATYVGNLEDKRDKYNGRTRLDYGGNSGTKSLKECALHALKLPAFIGASLSPVVVGVVVATAFGAISAGSLGIGLACLAGVMTAAFIASVLDCRKTQGGKLRRPAKRKSVPYVKTNKTHVGRDGVKRRVYVRGGKSYVKRRDAKTGKMVYRVVRRIANEFV